MTNPFAQQQPAEQPQTTGNPFAPSPTAPAQQPPAAPSYGAQAGGAPAPAWLAQATAAPVAPPAPPAQYAPPAAPQAAPPAINGFRSAGAPPAAGTGKGPKLPHMYGRLLMIFPLSRAQRPKKPEFITPEQHASGQTTQDTVTATVVVLDSGPGQMQPISFGGNPAAFPPVPDTESAPLPFVRKAMWITQTQIIGQIEGDLPAGPGAQPGVVLGRLTKAGPERNDPWYLLPASPQDEELARTYLGLVASGQYPHPLAP